MALSEVSKCALFRENNHHVIVDVIVLLSFCMYSVSGIKEIITKSKCVNSQRSFVGDIDIAHSNQRSACKVNFWSLKFSFIDLVSVV